MRMNGKIRALCGATAAAAVLAAAVGCGSSGNSSGHSATADTTAGAADAGTATVAPTAAPGVQEACAAVDEVKKAPVFEGPGAPTDASALKGKTIWYISAAQAVPVAKKVSEAVKESAALAGMKTVIFDGKGAVTEYNKGVNQAIAQKADAIILFAIAPKLVEGALAKAEAAGIPVIDSLNGNPDDAVTGQVDGHVTISYTRAGELIAQYSICDTDGKVNAAIFSTDELTTSPIERAGMLDKLKQCSDCKSVVEDVPIARWQERLGTLTQSLLQRDPDLNYLIPQYDGQVVFVAPGVAQAGKTGEVNVISLNADTPNLQFILDGEQIADLGEPNRWLGWAITDQTMRLMNGEKPLDQHIPMRMFDKSNLKGLDINNEQELYGNVDFQSDYKKLWGLE